MLAILCAAQIGCSQLREESPQAAAAAGAEPDRGDARTASTIGQFLDVVGGALKGAVEGAVAGALAAATLCAPALIVCPGAIAIGATGGAVAGAGKGAEAAGLPTGDKPARAGHR